MNQRTIVLSLVALCAPAAAQRTWIVDIDGRPGTDFTELSAAVAAAAPGDTVAVRPSAMGGGYSGFTTNKGLNIVSNQALLSTSSDPVVVTGLPAGQVFRMAGFLEPRNQSLVARFTGCQGVVQLEDMHALEYGFMFPNGPSISITNCALVTMVDVENFGTPAVQADSSRVMLTRCRLGVTSINIGGGPAVRGTQSTIDIVEPAFDAGPITQPSIDLTDCTLRLAGTATSYVQGGFGNSPAAAAVRMTRGSARIDPQVRLNPFWSGAPTNGTGTFTFGVTPAVLIEGDQPGATMTVTHVAGVGDTLVGLLGLPALPYPTPLGEALLAPNLLVTTVTTTLAARVFTQSIPVPASLAPGVGLCVQDVTLNSSGVTLGIGCAFVVH